MNEALNSPPLDSAPLLLLAFFFPRVSPLPRPTILLLHETLVSQLRGRHRTKNVSEQARASAFFLHLALTHSAGFSLCGSLPSLRRRSPSLPRHPHFYFIKFRGGGRRRRRTERLWNATAAAANGRSREGEGRRFLKAGNISRNEPARAPRHRCRGRRVAGCCKTLARRLAQPLPELCQSRIAQPWPPLSELHSPASSLLYG